MNLMAKLYQVWKISLFQLSDSARVGLHLGVYLLQLLLSRFSIEIYQVIYFK